MMILGKVQFRGTAEKLMRLVRKAICLDEIR